MDYTGTSILATTTVTSSDGLREYAMYKTPSGWQHADEGCQWWQRREGSEQEHDCKHVAEAAKKEKAALSNESITEVGGTTTALAVHEGIVIDGEVMPPGQLYRLIDEFDAELVVLGVESEVVESWGYTFGTGKSRVTGMSIRGVEAAAREMVKHGEIIRCEDPRIIAEDDSEIRLVCTAIRFLVNPNTGEQIETDRATRALRQSKLQKINVWEYDEQLQKNVVVGERWEEDPKWFEKAYSKAARNAMLPLLRQDVKAQVIAAFKDTPKYHQSLSPQERRELAAPPQQQRQQLPPAQQAPAQRQRAQTPRNAPAQAQPTAETPQTPPAPSESPTQASEESPAAAIARILSEINQSQGRQRYGEVGMDLLKTFPFIKDPSANKLRRLVDVQEDLTPVLARLRIWESGRDPNAVETQQEEALDEAEAPAFDADGDPTDENAVECVNCHVSQVVDLETLADDTPCAACGKPIGIEIVEVEG